MPTIEGSEDPNDFDHDNGILDGRLPALYSAIHYDVADGAGAAGFYSDENLVAATLMRSKNINRDYMLRTVIKQETGVWGWVFINDPDTYWNELIGNVVWTGYAWSIITTGDADFQALFSYAPGWATKMRFQLAGTVQRFDGYIKDTHGNTMSEFHNLYPPNDVVELTWHGYPLHQVYFENLSLLTPTTSFAIQFYANMDLI